MASPIQTWDVGTAATTSTGTSRTGPATTAGSLLIAALGVRDVAVEDITLTDDGGNTWTLVKSEPYAWLFACSGAAAITSLTPALLDTNGDPYSATHMLFLSEWPTGTVDAGAASIVDAPPVGVEVTPSAEGGTVLTMMTIGSTSRSFAPDTATVIQSLKSSQLTTTLAAETVTDDTPVTPTWLLTGGSSDLISVISATVTHSGDTPTPLSVDAGADQSVYVGQTASVGATASGGTGPYTYAWTKVSGPAGSFLNANQASTTFNPSGGAGTYVLRCIATDSTSTTAQDDLTLTVSQAPALVTVASVNASTGWTPTGGTVLQVLSDTSDATLVTSQENPTEQVLDVVMGPAVVAEGQHWTQRVRMRRSSSSTSGTATGYLYVGSTLISTVTGKTIPGSLGDVDFTFPNADVSAITAQQWTDGVRFVVEVTAA